MMDGGGTYTLGDVAITSPGDYMDEAVGWQDGLDGMVSATVQIAARIGTPGAKIQVFIQTSFDQGETAVDIANIVFTDQSGVKIINFSTAPKPAASATDGGMADDTWIDGFLGDRLRIKVISFGDYGGGTVIEGRATVR